MLSVFRVSFCQAVTLVNHVALSSDSASEQVYSFLQRNLTLITEERALEVVAKREAEQRFKNAKTKLLREDTELTLN